MTAPRPASAGTERPAQRALGPLALLAVAAAATAGGVGFVLHHAGGTAAALAWPVAGAVAALGIAGLAIARHATVRAASTAERTIEMQARRLRQLANSEAEAVAGRERVAAYLDAMPIGCFVAAEDGTLLYVNRVLAGWLGRDGDALVAEHTRLDDIAAGGSLEALFTDPEPQGVPLTLAVQGDGQAEDAGEPMPVVVTCRQARTASGHDVIVGLVQGDAAVAASPAYHVSGSRYVQFFDDAPIGIALLDPEGRVVECNRALRALAAEQGPALAGMAVVDLVAADDRDQMQARLARALEEEGRLRAPFEVRLAGEREPIVSVYTSCLRRADGKIDGLILHVIDLTEQKNLEVQFTQAQKMQAIGQLAGGIAHDFNNLLTAMLGFCDLLLMRHQAGDQSFSDIMQIKQNANRAASLVRQLLAFSRRQTLQAKVLDLTDVLSELSHLLRRLIGESIELDMVHGRDVGLVKGDPGQIEQVIINLAVNARDAMPQGGWLAIRTRNVRHPEPGRGGLEIMPAGDYVLVEIADTGTGIPKQILGKIFEPFFSTKEVGAGTGLGLSTVYGIVKQTGGYVFVDSEVGVGTTFSIYLPRLAATEKAAPEPAAPLREAPADLTGKGTVLLVEDEEVVRAFAARALRGKGYQVLEADGAEAALDIVRAHAEGIDLLITDVVMPHMHGPQLVHEIRKIAPELKVIFISGYAEEAFRGGLDGLSGAYFLPKPFSLKQLALKVKEAFEPVDA